jgi:hypothetical protein
MRKSRYTEAQIVSILKELVEGRVSGAPTRARDYDAPQSSSSQHVQVPILARSGAPNCCCRTSCLPAVDLGPRGRTFAFPYGVRQVFGAKDVCRDKCSVRCGDDACRDKCSALCGDGSCKLNTQSRCYSRPHSDAKGPKKDIPCSLRPLRVGLGLGRFDRKFTLPTAPLLLNSSG